MSARARRSLDVVLDDASLGLAATIGTLYCDQHDANSVVNFEYHTDYLDSRHAAAIDPQPLRAH